MELQNLQKMKILKRYNLMVRNGKNESPIQSQYLINENFRS